MSDTRVLQLTDCLIDLDASEVRRGSERLILSEQEVGIIETLMAAGERTVSQADLYRDAEYRQWVAVK